MAHATRNATANVVVFIWQSPLLAVMVVLRLLFQHAVEAVEHRHPPLEQIVIILGGRRQTLDGEIHARGLLASELAIVQVRFVDDLRDQLHPAVPDAEPLDECLEGAVLAVVAELSPEDVEGNTLARGIGRVGERELSSRVAEPFDEPGGSDPIDVRPRARDPRASRRRHRATTGPRAGRWPRFEGTQALGGGLPGGFRPLRPRRA